MKSPHLKQAQEKVALLEQCRNPLHEAWRELSDYMSPGRGKLSHRNGWDMERGKKMLDSTAVRAVRVLASGMQSGLSSPARPWFRLRRLGDESRESGPSRRWLDEVEGLIYSALARSNFYQAIHGLYTELSVFGSANLYMEPCPERGLRFECLTAGEYAWGLGENGRVSSVARRFKVPVSALAARFGTARLSLSARKKLNEHTEGQHTMVELVHLVEPRYQRRPQFTDQMNLPYASIIYEDAPEAVELLHMGGFAEFPHLCARWETVSGEIYGRSPGLDALPDVRMLQEMVKSQLMAIHKLVNPPMRVPLGFKQRLSLAPGAVNFINPGQGEGVGPLYQINPDLNALSHKIEDVRRSVREGFFNDLFLMFSGKGGNLTATEVLERSHEKLLLLGPVVERHQTEILDPLISRAFGILLRAGELPDMPPELREQNLKIEFVSSLAQAQRMGVADGIRRLASDVSSLAAVSPGVLDKLDFDQAVDELASLAGIPSSMIKSDAEVAELRALRQQEQMGQVLGQSIGQNLGQNNDLALNPASENGGLLETLQSVLAGFGGAPQPPSDSDLTKNKP